MVQPIPEGYHTVVPYLLVDDVGALVAFVEQALARASPCSRKSMPMCRLATRTS